MLLSTFAQESTLTPSASTFLGWAFCWVLICGLGFLYTQRGEYIIILYTLTYIQIIGCMQGRNLSEGIHLDRFVTRCKFKDNFGSFGISRTCVEQWDVHAHACMGMEASMGCSQVFRTDLIKGIEDRMVGGKQK